MLPTRVHAIVLVSKLHKPTMRALAYAKASRPNVLEAVMVATDQTERDRIIDEWDRRGIDVPLKILDSPYREVIRPIVEYAKAIRAAQPRGVVAVFIPEYVVGRWWEQLLHNQTALRLKTRLLFTPGVMMTSVPYQLRSSQIGEERAARQDEHARAGRTLRRLVRRPSTRTWIDASSYRCGDRSPAGRAAARVVGETFDVEVGPVAHGGHFVARLAPEQDPEVGGTVVFVRHALPGELVTVQITEGRWATGSCGRTRSPSTRPSQDRVPPPCRYAGPGRCGGCDFQHVALVGAATAEGSRSSRSSSAGWPASTASVEVEPVPGDDDGLRWRTRMRFHPAAGRRRWDCGRTAPGPCVPVDDCLIQAPGARVSVEGEPEPSEPVVETVRGRSFEVAADGFWQVHLGAPETLVDAVLAGAGVRPGDRVLDLYSGVGLFTAFLAEAVGETGSVLAVEGDRTATEHALVNLAAYPWVEVVPGSVDRVLQRLDGAGRRRGARPAARGSPPAGGRAGRPAGPAHRRPRRLRPGRLRPGRGAVRRGAGTRSAGLRAFDLFPMTQHVEVVGTLCQSPLMSCILISR